MIWPSQASVGSPASGSVGSMAPSRPVAGSAVGGCRAAAIFSMSGPVGVERGERPLGAGDRRDRDRAAGDRGGEAGGLGHLEVRHPGELLVADPLERIDVGLALAPGGDGEGELPGAVPLDRPLGAEHLQQITEERHPFERVGAGAHGAMVRPDVAFCPCGRQAQAMVRVVVTGAASSLGRRVVRAPVRPRRRRRGRGRSTSRSGGGVGRGRPGHVATWRRVFEGADGGHPPGVGLRPGHRGPRDR